VNPRSSAGLCDDDAVGLGTERLLLRCRIASDTAGVETNVVAVHPHDHAVPGEDLERGDSSRLRRRVSVAAQLERPVDSGAGPVVADDFTSGVPRADGAQCVEDASRDLLDGAHGVDRAQLIAIEVQERCRFLPVHLQSSANDVLGVVRAAPSQ
jgi:hypothetical protein